MFFTQPTMETRTEQGRNVSQWISQVDLSSICPENVIKIWPQNIKEIFVLKYVHNLAQNIWNGSFGMVPI